MQPDEFVQEPERKQRPIAETQILLPDNVLASLSDHKGLGKPKRMPYSKKKRERLLRTMFLLYPLDSPVSVLLNTVVSMMRLLRVSSLAVLHSIVCFLSFVPLFSALGILVSRSTFLSQIGLGGRGCIKTRF